jgi:hypothetical protein
VDAPITCVALLQDRFNNMLGASTQVMFMSEATRVGQVTWTPQYDPTKKAADQPQVGSAVEIFGTLGGYLPKDVDPIPGEYSFAYDPDGCGVRTHNPRDGLVTIIAIADGEEAFFDVNGNGVYDPGEPFVDLGEPFVDANDNGIHDPDEWFLDVNGNHQYDGPNGVWDANTKIWTQTVVMYSGYPLPALAVNPPTNDRFMGTRLAGPNLGLPGPGACTPTPAASNFQVTPGGLDADTYYAYASDQNFNRLAHDAIFSANMTWTTDAKAFYNGFAQLPDATGMFYAYWPCKAAGPTGTALASPLSCTTQCTSGRCLMQPSVSNYSCGYRSTAGVESGLVGDLPTIYLEWSARLFSSQATYTVGGLDK